MRPTRLCNGHAGVSGLAHLARRRALDWKVPSWKRTARNDSHPICSITIFGFGRAHGKSLDCVVWGSLGCLPWARWGAGGVF